MDLPNKRRPRRNDERIILQFDYDCFYAQVYENQKPELKNLPLGVKQKNCLATCNYHARARGLTKLMSISEAKRKCPELVLVDGEDLTPFRDMSKTLFNFFKTFSWNHKAERLGFDEVFMATTEDEVIAFVDTHKLRRVPGLGSKIVQVLGTHVGADMSKGVSEVPELSDNPVTVGDVRLHSSISPGMIESLLTGPGAEKGVGARIWGLLHGVDATEVKEVSDVPSQISIEDTYKGLDSMAQITEELHKLSCSLIRRMRTDLLVPDDGTDVPGAQKWMARPKTLRLSVRTWAYLHSTQGQNYGRVSRSGPLPNYIFGLEDDIEHIAERLVSGALLPLLRRLSPEKGQRWNLQMLNICVANMALGAADDKTGAGRDISAMFKRQDEILKPFQVIEERQIVQSEVVTQPVSEGDSEHEEEDYDWDMGDNATCPLCGHSIPLFAVLAHQRYHEMEEG
ncbi:DNA polymerase iota subunit [Fusarium heterosporum]|uniref:DNA polymerase iota subunit n=1 Tax=Fusarium heterosporum TaxID=42747 RepID=A0A8H5STF2_FUSHE|nr:DNA polymerase iota subunit [Fusarium heterosporum]